MKQSQLFTKTLKTSLKDEPSVNAQLLIRGGFVQKEIAGVYAFMPLGFRVLQKIIQIIREEMNAIGGLEVYLASLQNPDIWKQTNRWDDSIVDVWFKTKLHSGQELGLANTHEEPLTHMMTHYVRSYKDLPIFAYQFQLKFRNELRAKSGLLRTREFIMKDLYSFCRTEEELDYFYEQAKEAYRKIFNRIGIGDKTFLTFASGGAFSKYSHEFQTLCENGEDIIYLDKEKGIAVNKEVYTDDVLAELGLNKQKLIEHKSIEVGNIFKLKAKYSAPLELLYTDDQGNQQPVVMGSYGIGPSRSMATVVELCHDAKGIIWPEIIAPFKVHLIGLNLDNNLVEQRAQAVYKKLLEMNIEVLYDDRKDVTPGEKLSDADLIGIPYRVVVSNQTKENVEVKKRSQDNVTIKKLEELLNELSTKN